MYTKARRIRSRKDQKENYISGQYEVTNTVLIEFPLLIKTDLIMKTLNFQNKLSYIEDDIRKD